MSDEAMEMIEDAIREQTEAIKELNESLQKIFYRGDSLGTSENPLYVMKKNY